MKRSSANPALSDGDFIRLFNDKGPDHVAKISRTTKRAVFYRRETLERKYKRQIPGPANHRATRRAEDHPGRICLEIKNGVVLVGGDAHYWPGRASTAHRAFVKFCKDQKPVAVVMNGDAFDGATISRHPPIGWENRPAVIDELEAVQERLGEIEKAAFKARKLWPLGNHDARFETRLATTSPEYARVHGFHLKDHIPLWESCWSCWINDSVVIKHRGPKGGVHATHNNVLAAGKSFITNHLHSAKVTPFNNYGPRTLWGVDTGCLADPHGPQFLDYTEDNPRNHRAGFCVLTFVDGELLQPELVLVWDENRVQWRGKLISV